MKNLKIYKKLRDLLKKKNRRYYDEEIEDYINDLSMDDLSDTEDVIKTSRVKEILSNGFTLVKDFGLQLGSKAKGLWSNMSTKFNDFVLGNNLDPISSKRRKKTIKRAFAVAAIGIVLVPGAHVAAKNISNFTFGNNSYSTSDTDLDTDLSSDSNKKVNEDMPAEKSTKDTPSSKDSEDTPVKKDSEDTPVNKDTEDTPVIKDTEDTPVSKDTDDTPVSKDTDDTPVSKDTEDDDYVPEIVEVPFDVSFDEYYDLYNELTDNTNDNSADTSVNEDDMQDINNIELGSKITIKDGSKIYDNVYDSSYENNELNPYFDGDMERTVFSIAFEYEGKLVYCDIHDADAQEKVDFLKQNGAKVMSVITSIDGEGYEGAYNIKSISKVLVNDNNKQLVK